MRRALMIFTVIVSSGLLAAPAVMQDMPVGASPYDVVDGWLKPFASSGHSFGATSAVFAESPDRIFIAQRGENRLPDPVPPGFQGFLGSIGVRANTAAESRVWQNTIFIVDGDGNMTEAWTQWDDMFETDAEGASGIHKIKISPYDPDRKLWVADTTNHQVHAFSNDGEELVMSLGAGGAGDDDNHLDRPWDMAFTEDGSIFVADMGNSRVMKFDAQGNFVTTWGVNGSGRGEFAMPHAVATDSIGRIYVGDMGNNRVQVFNETTRSVWYHPNISPIATWPGFERPTDIYATGYDVWISDNGEGNAAGTGGDADPTRSARMVKLDWNGNPQFTWELAGFGTGAGEALVVHQFSVDAEKNFYAADPGHGRVQKFAQKEGASFMETFGAPDPPLQ